MPAPFPRPVSVMGLAPDDPPRRARRKWRAKFGDAFRGWKRGVRGHSSFSVHFFAAALVIAGAIAFRCEWVEWCLLLAGIGAVLTAELFNSAVEALFHGQDESVKPGNYQALDIAAGAVLMASVTAALVGAVIFGRRIWLCFAA